MRRLLLAALLASSLPAAAFPWGKKTDEERLKKKTEGLRVQLYLTAKTAVVKGATSDEMKVVADRFVETAAASKASVEVKLAAMKGDAGSNTAQASALKGDAGNATVQAAAALAAPTEAPPPAKELSTKELAALGKALFELRHVGKAVLEADKTAAAPLLPVLLAPVPLPAGFKDRLDANTDHALMFVALSVVTLHPAIPVPLPQDIVLYEGSQMDPATVKFDGFTAPLHGLRAYSYAMNGLCDFGAKESAAVAALGPTGKEQLAAGLLQLTGKTVAVTDASAGHVDAASQSLAHGSVSLCHFQKAELEKGSAALLSFLDTAEKNGLKSNETQLLRAYAECATGHADEGRARMKSLSALSESELEDVAMLEKACGKDLSKADALVSTARLGKLVARGAWGHLEKSGVLEKLSEMEWVRATSRFGGKLSGSFKAIPGGISSAVD